MGRIARTRFDSDLEAEFDQFFHDVRYCRHTLFSGKGLLGTPMRWTGRVGLVCMNGLLLVRGRCASIIPACVRCRT